MLIETNSPPFLRPKTSPHKKPLSPPRSMLHTHDALKYTWQCWRYLGMLPFMEPHRIYWAYALLLNLYSAVLFPSLYVASFFVHLDLADKIVNLSVALPLLYTTAKQAILFYYIQRHLPKAALHLNALDRRAELHRDDCAYLKRTVRYCQWGFLTYLVAFWSGLFFYGLIGIMRHKLPFEGWIPLDWQHSQCAYITACALQMICLITQVTNAACSDTYSVIYLVLLMAHLHVLNVRIKRIGNCEATDEDSNYQQLVACVQDHWECMSYYNCIRSPISTTNFIQFLSTALGLSAPAIAFVGSDFTVSQFLKFIIFFPAIIVEVAPSCWFMDEVSLEMSKLTTSLFSCRWYAQSPRFRHALIIFMQRSQKADKIRAANIVAVSLETFTSIIKFAFSLFTLLNQMKS